MLTFMESIGRRSETELYLKLFREVPKESFGIIVVEASVARHIRASLVEQLSFLRRLELVAPLLLGVFDPARAARTRAGLVSALTEAGLEPSEHRAGAPGLVQRLEAELRACRVPLVSFDVDQDEATRFRIVDELLSELKSRKLVVLRGQGALGAGVSPLALGAPRRLPVHDGGISLINLSTDLDPLLASGVLPSGDASLLTQLARLARAERRVQVSVASPLVLLKELFTVRGAGTLIQRGSEIERLERYDDASRGALSELLESAFQRRLILGTSGAPRLFERRPEAIYLERQRRGAAILEPGVGGAFLTKFAVDQVAQGEGLGRDLWQALTRDTPRFYWRARPDNPISAWYAEHADGLLRVPGWTLFWRGIGVDGVSALVQDALARPEDLEPR